MIHLFTRLWISVCFRLNFKTADVMAMRRDEGIPEYSANVVYGIGPFLTFAVTVVVRSKGKKYGTDAGLTSPGTCTSATTTSGSRFPTALAAVVSGQWIVIYNRKLFIVYCFPYDGQSKVSFE